MNAPPCQFNRMLEKMKILSMEARVALSMEELGERLKVFFGREGLGLDVKEDGRGCMTFEDGGAYITADYCTEGKRRACTS